MNSPSICVIGGGFAGLSTACYLAKEGYDVTLLEKNGQLGGRAQVYRKDGFSFDMGPSWYWMPDVFERFFNDFGKTTSDFYNLLRLDPGYRVVFSESEEYDIPADWGALKALFESIEEGAGDKLDSFIAGAQKKYDVGINKLVYKPGNSLMDYMEMDLLTGLLSLQVFTSISSHIRKYFTNPRLIQMLEFPVLFLGAKPQNTPALYSLMNYADLKLGTWYPMGGMVKIVEAMESIAKELGVKIHVNEEVEGFKFEGNRILSVNTINGEYPFDTVVCGADYQFVDTKLLPSKFRSYSEKYWDSRTLAPSALLFYLGIKGKIDKLKHHVLFFDSSFDVHASAIYDNPDWPEDPLFYVNCPSKTDESVSDSDKETITILIPLAPDLDDNEEMRENLFNKVMDRLESYTGEKIRDRIILKQSYAHKEFKEDYHAFKGNAYGLANTLAQTGPLKPALKSKKVENLFYTGQLTVPGPGVPPSLISGKVVFGEVKKQIEKYEAAI